MIQDRNDLPQFLSGIGVEIGVDRGAFSERLLRDSHLSVLYSIDPWNSEAYGLKQWAEASLRLERFGSRSKILMMTGQRASAHILPESLDFVYIDSSHTYQETKEELHLWWPKLKPNGLLAGHDYANGPDVKKAVEECKLVHGLQVETTVRDADWKDYLVNSWMIRVPS